MTPSIRAKIQRLMTEVHEGKRTPEQATDIMMQALAAYRAEQTRTENLIADNLERAFRG